ncbi:MAG: DMT family transporter [Euryarchaeota archaeon]|nr:DMT family transporter [Euryarchaeota archaeon]
MKHDLSLILVTFFWGLTFVTVKEAIAFIPPFNFLLYRFSIAFLLLLIVSAKKIRHIDFYTLKSGLFIGVFLFLGYALQTVGLKYTTPANAGFITGLSVVIVPFLSSILFKTKLKKNVIVGVALACIGLAFLSLQKFAISYGDFLILLCAFAFAMHIILVGKYAPKMDIFSITTIQIGAVAIFSFFFSFTESSFEFNTVIWKALIITAVFATVLAFLLQNAAQKHVSPTHTALIFAMEPVFAALCSYLLISEIFTLQKMLGCIFILCGMIITRFRRTNRVKKV